MAHKKFREFNFSRTYLIQNLYFLLFLTIYLIYNTMDKKEPCSNCDHPYSFHTEHPKGWCDGFEVDYIDGEEYGGSCHCEKYEETRNQ